MTKHDTTLKLRAVGNSTAVVLPKDVLARMNLKQGDSVTLTETPDGFLLTPYDPQFEDKVAKARDLMGRYRNTLKELAK